jgi:hypothetical protein
MNQLITKTIILLINHWTMSRKKVFTQNSKKNLTLGYDIVREYDFKEKEHVPTW